MRLVQVLVPDEKRTRILRRLDEEGIDFVVFEEAEGTDRAMVEFPLPTEGVQELLDALGEVGLDDDYVVVSRIETAQTRNFAELESRYVAETEEGIAPAEIRSRAMEMSQGPLTYFAMTLFSALVATSGLLLDSAAVVVGSMVIAPQVGSAVQVSVGSVLDDRRMLLDGMRSQLLGLALAVLGAAGFGWALRATGVVPSTLLVTTIEQVAMRTSPGMLSLTVAVAAGFAGAISLATAVSTSLVGVMIAAALIPAAATMGIGLAWGLPAVVFGSFVLLVVNVVSINLTGIAGLWTLGYRPATDHLTEGARRLPLSGLRSVAAIVLVLGTVFAGAGVVMADHVTFENAASSAVEDVLSQQGYERLELVSVQSAFGLPGPAAADREVTVVLNRPPGTGETGVAEAIRERVAATTGQSVSVEVEYEVTETAGGGTGAAMGQSSRGAVAPHVRSEIGRDHVRTGKGPVS